MNNVVMANILRFVLLLLAQTLICNNINLFGFLNPYVYIIYILLFPIKNTKAPLLISSFLLGLLIDVFLDTVGAHAAASVTLAYFRSFMLKLTFGVQYEYQNVKIANTTVGNLIIYCAFAVFLHHIVLFWLEIFSISQMVIILKSILFNTIFSLLSIVLIILFFNRSK